MIHPMAFQLTPLTPPETTPTPMVAPVMHIVLQPCEMGDHS